MTDPVVLGIDPSLHFGWAVNSARWNRPKFGLIELINPDEYGYGRCLCDLAGKVGDIIEGHGVTDVFIEQPILIINPQRKRQISINLSSRLTLYKIEGAVEMEVYRRGLPDVRWVTIQSWRKRYLGTDRAPPGITRDEARRDWWKREAKKACAARDLYITDDNVAEAVGVCDFGLSVVCPIYRNRTDPVARRAEIQPISD